MTAYYHTPHSTTERIPATGETLNAPLGQLDQALKDVYVSLAASQTLLNTLEGIAAALQTAKMDKAVYDPNEVNASVFDRANHSGTQEPSTISPQGAGSSIDADFLRGLSPSEIGGNTKGHITNGRLVRTAANAYLVEHGSLDIDGVVLAHQTIARTGLTLMTNRVYYVYLYNDNNEVAAEESTTYPVWNALLGYFVKSDDATRRWVNWFSTNASGGIRNFLNICNGRDSETIFIDGQDGTGTKRVLAYGDNTSRWVIFYLNALVPYYATHWLAAPNLQCASALDDAILGLSPSDLNSALADEAPYHIQAHSQKANGFFSPGAMWLLMTPTPEYYYRIKNVVGSLAAGRVEAHGARIVR